MSVTAIVAIAGAITTSIAAVAGPIAAWLIAKGGREHEERLTREARYFEARRSVYEDATTEFAAETQQMRVTLKRFDVEVETYRLPETPKHTPQDEAARLRGRVVPIASESVVAAFDAFADAALMFWTTVIEIVNTGDEGDVIPLSESAKLHPLFRAALAARADFEAAVRRDMHPE